MSAIGVAEIMLYIINNHDPIPSCSGTFILQWQGYTFFTNAHVDDNFLVMGDDNVQWHLGVMYDVGVKNGFGKIYWPWNSMHGYWSVTS